jgi:CRP-like cAMP-binding protein
MNSASGSWCGAHVIRRHAFAPPRQLGAHHNAPPIPASSILDALPSEVSRGLFAHGRSISFEAEQTLFIAGDEGDGCYRVEDGLLKASVGAPNGGERILAILGPGSVVGELSMIDGAPRSRRRRCQSAKLPSFARPLGLGRVRIVQRGQS